MDILERLERAYEAKQSIDKEEIKMKIMGLLSSTPSPSDGVIHKMADDLGINVHMFESIIYEILGSFVGYGMAKKKGFKEEDADVKELKMGIKVEAEHTNWSPIAKRIALDHLSEIPDYYTRLAKMESDAGVKH